MYKEIEQPGDFEYNFPKQVRAYKVIPNFRKVLGAHLDRDKRKLLTRALPKDTVAIIAEDREEDRYLENIARPFVEEYSREGKKKSNMIVTKATHDHRTYVITTKRRAEGIVGIIQEMHPECELHYQNTLPNNILNY